MDNAQRERLGHFAVAHGTPDDNRDASRRERATDAVANVLHYLASQGEDDPPAILSSATSHYLAEREPAAGRWSFDAEVQVTAANPEEARERAEELAGAVLRMDTGSLYLPEGQPERVE